MKIDRPAQSILTKMFGQLKSGDSRVRFHSENLNEDRRGNPKGQPWHGRAWLNFRKNSTERSGVPCAADAVGFNWEWVLGSKSAGLSFEADPSDHEFQFHWALPPVSVFFTVALGWDSLKWFWNNETLFDKGYEGRTTHLKIHDWTLWWEFWHPSMSWTRGTPKWRHWSFNFQDKFLGKRHYHEEVYETKNVTIPLPEGEYQGTAKLYDAVFGWERLPWKSRLSSVEIKVDPGIPFSGKGENSYDCGDDACFGRSGPARSIEAAIGGLVGSVLETRRKRGDPAKWPEYPPKKTPPPAPDNDRLKSVQLS